MDPIQSKFLVRESIEKLREECGWTGRGVKPKCGECQSGPHACAHLGGIRIEGSFRYNAHFAK